MNESLLQFDWRLPTGVHAAFTTRVGGASSPPWDSFNVASHVGDDAARAWSANRARLKTLLALPAEPAWLNQVHGTSVADLDSQPEGVITSDAAATRQAGGVCVVMVADCLPVLFASRDGRRIAAAHAGWRGLASGVLEQTVAALGVRGEVLSAWLGPAISQEHFEVGDEVRGRICRRGFRGRRMRSCAMRAGVGRRISWNSRAAAWQRWAFPRSAAGSGAPAPTASGSIPIDVMERVGAWRP